MSHFALIRRCLLIKLRSQSQSHARWPEGSEQLREKYTELSKEQLLKRAGGESVVGSGEAVGYSLGFQKPAVSMVFSGKTLVFLRDLKNKNRSIFVLMVLQA